jgi:hypothetical protein
MFSRIRSLDAIVRSAQMKKQQQQEEEKEVVITPLVDELNKNVKQKKHQRTGRVATNRAAHSLASRERQQNKVSRETVVHFS